VLPAAVAAHGISPMAKGLNAGSASLLNHLAVLELRCFLVFPGLGSLFILVPSLDSTRA
jgi:hypothetical protein